MKPTKEQTYKTATGMNTMVNKVKVVAGFYGYHGRKQIGREVGKWSEFMSQSCLKYTI